MPGRSHTSLQEFMKGTPASLPEDLVTGSATSPPPSVTGRGCLYVFHAAVNVKWLLQATAQVKYERCNLRRRPRVSRLPHSGYLGSGQETSGVGERLHESAPKALGPRSVQISSISAWRMLPPRSPPPLFPRCFISPTFTTRRLRGPARLLLSRRLI